MVSVSRLPGIYEIKVLATVSLSNYVVHNPEDRNLAEFVYNQ
jgi:hypothetical protein